MSSAKNGRPVNWLKTKHGDQVTLTVSNDDQKNGIPGSVKNCAVVQTLVRSAPDVYDAKVVEGNINIWVHGTDTRDWRGRLIMDKTTRELAIKYDDYIMSAPTTITLIVDKWHEVTHYKRARKVSGKVEKVTHEPEFGPELEGGQESVQSQDIEQPEIIEQELAQKRRRRQSRRKNRWDISHYLVPANIE
jgi:hypothetical protein